MFKNIFIITLAAYGICLAASNFEEAIARVESNGNDNAIGDNGRAVGRYQIHMIVVREVNRLYGTSYTGADRKDAVKALDIMRKYLAHWGKVYTRKTGNPVTDEVRARIWNGGPYGWRKSATERYWEKVKKAMEEE